MTWGSVWDGFIFVRPGIIFNFAFLITLWRGAGSLGTFVAGCCVNPLRCDGSDVCSNLWSCAGGCDGSCGTSMLKMTASCFSTAIFFSKLWDGSGWGWVLEGFCEVSCRVCYCICWVRAWEFLLHWEEFRHVRESFQLCIGYVLCKTYIMYHIRMYIPSFLDVWCPGDPVVQFFVPYGYGPWVGA